MPKNNSARLLLDTTLVIATAVIIAILGSATPVLIIGAFTGYYISSVAMHMILSVLSSFYPKLVPNASLEEILVFPIMAPFQMLIAQPVIAIATFVALAALATTFIFFPPAILAAIPLSGWALNLVGAAVGVMAWNWLTMVVVKLNPAEHKIKRYCLKNTYDSFKIAETNDAPASEDHGTCNRVEDLKHTHAWKEYQKLLKQDQKNESETKILMEKEYDLSDEDMMILTENEYKRIDWDIVQAFHEPVEALRKCKKD